MAWRIIDSGWWWRAPATWQLQTYRIRSSKGGPRTVKGTACYEMSQRATGLDLPAQQLTAKVILTALLAVTVVMLPLWSSKTSI